MFQKLLDKVKCWLLLRDNQEAQDQLPTEIVEGKKIAKKLKQNQILIEDVFADNYDICIREFSVSKHNIKDAFLVFIDGMTEEKVISENILKPLMNSAEKAIDLNKITKSIISTPNISEAFTIEEVVEGVTGGKAALFLDGEQKVILVDSVAFESRAVEKPEVETTIRGPKESFVEDLAVNTSLLRRKLNNTNLKLEQIILGQQTKTDVCLAYVKGVANEKIVDEVRSRVSEIELDAILESGYIEEFIVDHPLSVFSTVANSEKPDIVAGKLLEGRIAVFVNGTPTVLTVPHIFVESLMTAEDYYSAPYLVSLIRIIRYAAFVLALLLPATYIAVVSFHPELLPTELAISVAIASEGVPFPKAVEVIVMGFLFEILREAGVRMPRAVGQAISIVGALILGDAAINAGLVGAPVVIVTALTAISSFIVPPLTDAITILRLVAISFASVMGLPGILTFIIGLVIHLSSLRSFGVPYLYPLAPLDIKSWKDVFIRVPWWLMVSRPELLSKDNRQRAKLGQRPSPYRDELERDDS
ncbi:spore germination protein [Natroniella sulfidigena]|uniref:spore germination protein n=1 Tax=Natroniella sulfidigena TaxID=723921 RepID=UPI00200BA148|nr:spore germination protein [Natroniella sulfidigena]